MLQVCDGADGCDCVSEVRCEEGREEFGHRDAIASINRQHRELTITKEEERRNTSPLERCLRV